VVHTGLRKPSRYVDAVLAAQRHLLPQELFFSALAPRIHLNKWSRRGVCVKGGNRFHPNGWGQPRDNKLMAQDDSAKLESLPQLSTMPAIVEHWRQHHQIGAKGANVRFGGALSANVSVDPYPDVLLQAAVTILADRIAEGQIVEGVSLAWFEIISQIESDPDFLFKIPARRVEEIVADAYQRAGWEVILTPRSGDRGRDVIATRSGIISIRIVDQIKAYRLGHMITADDVRSMLGVLHIDRNVSKGLVTTTGRFAPGIEKDRGIIAFMPYRLNFKNGDQLRLWLLELAGNKPYAVKA
jgi:restriction system protein